MNLKKHIAIIALATLGCLGITNAAVNDNGTVAIKEKVIDTGNPAIVKTVDTFNLDTIAIGDIVAKSATHVYSLNAVNIVAIKATENTAALVMNTAPAIENVDNPLGVGDNNIGNIAKYSDTYGTGNIVVGIFRHLAPGQRMLC